MHEFSFKATNPKDPEIVYYRCIACYNLKKQLGREEKSPIAHLTLKNGVIITDPDNPSTPHSCTPGNVALVGKTLAQRHMVEVRTQVRENRKRPRQAYDEAVYSVDECYENHPSEIRDAIKSELSSGYGFASKRRALSRNRHFNVIKGNSLDAIHPDLQKTKDGQRFLQFEDKTDGRRMLVFFSEKDLHALKDAQYVLGDGNFKYNPMEFHNPGRLYTLHSIVKGEAQPVIYALMQSCGHPRLRSLAQGGQGRNGR